MKKFYKNILKESNSNTFTKFELVVLNWIFDQLKGEQIYQYGGRSYGLFFRELKNTFALTNEMAAGLISLYKENLTQSKFIQRDDVIRKEIRKYRVRYDKDVAAWVSDYYDVYADSEDEAIKMVDTENSFYEEDFIEDYHRGEVEIGSDGDIFETDVELLESIKKQLNILKESIPIYKEANPHKKVWDNFRKGFPKTPEYVLKDFFDATFMKSPENLKTVIRDFNSDPKPYLGKYWHDFFNSDWKLEILNVNPEDFTENTINAFLERSFGDEDAYLVPDDKERTKLQKKLAKGNAMNEPVIIVKKGNKYELIEGWHRTMAALLLGDNGEDLKNWDKVKIRAWVSTPK